MSQYKLRSVMCQDRDVLGTFTERPGRQSVVWTLTSTSALSNQILLQFSIQRLSLSGIRVMFSVKCIVRVVQLCNSAGPPMSQNLFTDWLTDWLTGSPRVSTAKGCNLSPECPWGRGSHYRLGRRRCKQSVSAGRQRCSFAQIHLSPLTRISACLSWR